jgi:hypothetical protein
MCTSIQGYAFYEAICSSREFERVHTITPRSATGMDP